jgi:hypothetical protein
MLRRNRRKMGIALILFITGLMLMRLAFASIAGDISVVLIVIGTFLCLYSLNILRNNKATCQHKVSCKEIIATTVSNTYLYSVAPNLLFVMIENKDTSLVDSAICRRCKKDSDYRIQRDTLGKLISLIIPVKRFWCPHCNRFFYSKK